MGDSMDVDVDFKSLFYNLEGTHINERKKNLNKLLKSTRPDIPEDQIDIQPRNYQERIFYVDVLIYFKKVDKLIEILQEGVGVLSSKILKEKWFFQEAFRNMSEDDIVNTFLPTLSYSLRMKVLKKLSLTLSEERMDNIFDFVLKRYGLFIAKQFLFGCSREKIIQVLTNNEITLLSEQLKRILQKSPDLLKIYFEQYKKNSRNDFDDCDFLSYMVWKHPNLYFQLELHNKSLKVGRYTTKAVLESNREAFLKDIKNSIWNEATVVREVKDFDKEHFVKFFPENMKDIIYSPLESYLSKYPIKKRWPVLSYAFKQVYNKEIVEHLDNFLSRLADVFPEEIRQKWAQIKYTEREQLLFIKYFNPQKAFTFLKDKINVTADTFQRGQLLNELISVCYENKDYSTYKEVLKYICQRHRNADKNIRDNLIFHMKSRIDYNLITEVHWKYINEIVDVRRVKGESLPFTIIVQYLVFVYEKKLPLDGPVTQYAKDCIKVNKSFRLWYKLKEPILKTPEAEGTILKHIVKILPTINLDNNTEVTCQILSNIVDFNRDLINDKISKGDFKKHLIDLNECEPIIDLIKDVCAEKESYNTNDYDVVKCVMLYNCLYSENPLKVISEDKLLDIIKTIFEDEDKCDMFNEHILEVIKNPKRHNFENKLLDYFFNYSKEKDTDSVKEKAIKHFSDKEPEVIAKYFGVILPLEVKYSNNMLDYNVIKKYSHLGLDEQIISHFKNLVSPNSKCEKKLKLLTALSLVMTTKDFLDLVKGYTPEVKKLDLDNEEQRELYQIQCNIATKVFKNLDEPAILGPILMHFCQGDYLQSSLATLYSVLYRINEEQASYYINALGVRAMSTRKHAVYLSFELLSLKEAMTVYSVLCNKETNISSKKYLFNAILKYFLKNPFEPLLDFVFLNMDFIDKNDSEMIEKLVESVSKIPKGYAPLFIEKVWNHLDTLEQREVKVIDYRKTLLVSTNTYGVNIFLRLNTNFCNNLIRKYFLSNDHSFQRCSSVLDHFIINYLLACSDEQHFEFVFDVIKSYKDQHWESNDKDKIDNILRFFMKTYEYFDDNDVKFLKMFESFWQRTFNHEECFFEYIFLRLMVLYKENSNIETFSKAVDRFFQELSGQYGPYITDILIDCVSRFFNFIDTENKQDFNSGNFSFYLLKSNYSELNCFIACGIMKKFPSDQNEIYFKVVDALKAVESATLKIYYNILLKRKLY